MKYILVALSGAADQSLDELGAKTPFEMAKIPNLNYFARTGKLGQVRLAPDRLEPYPDVTFLNLLGYDADKLYTGRGPLEAANLELKLEDNEIPFRMNFVTEYNGCLADPEAGKVTTKEAKALITYLNKKVSSSFVKFFAGAGYRHVVVIKDSHGFDALSAKTTCPHDMIGAPLEGHLPKGPGGELLKKLMYDAKLLLQDHEVNQVRIDLKENPANMIWLWGQGPKPKLDKFSDRFGLSGAMISDSEYAKGFARLIGLTVVDVHEHEDDLQANYEEKGKVLIEEIQEKDLICLHLKDCDEAGRRGDLRAKVAALEAADYFIFSKMKSYLEKHQDVRILVTPCHATSWKEKRRMRDPVPFAIVGKNIMADDSERFTELTAKASEFRIQKPGELITHFLSK